MTNTGTPCDAPAVPRRTQRRSPRLFSFVFLLLASLVLLPSLFLRFLLFFLSALPFFFLSFFFLFSFFPSFFRVASFFRFASAPSSIAAAVSDRSSASPAGTGAASGPSAAAGASGSNPRADALSAAARLAPMPGTAARCSIDACATASTESIPCVFNTCAVASPIPEMSVMFMCVRLVRSLRGHRCQARQVSARNISRSGSAAVNRGLSGLGRPWIDPPRGEAAVQATNSGVTSRTLRRPSPNASARNPACRRPRHASRRSGRVPACASGAGRRKRARSGITTAAPASRQRMTIPRPAT